MKGTNDKLNELSLRIKHTFSDLKLLTSAITHRSSTGTNNERLEFLGDAVLSFVIADELYGRFPKAREGDLTRMRAALVKGETIASIARNLELGKFLQLGQGEKKSGGFQRESILADALEAIIGAIFLDSNIETCRACILSWYEDQFDHLNTGQSQKDPKTELQEYLQGKRQPLPTYRVVKVVGDAHHPVFHVACQVCLLEAPSIGVGNTRRKAEQDAALAVLRAIDNAN